MPAAHWAVTPLENKTEGMKTARKLRILLQNGVFEQEQTSVMGTDACVMTVMVVILCGFVGSGSGLHMSVYAALRVPAVLT